MSTNTLVVGSIGAIAQRSGQSIAVTFMSAEIIAIVDVSGSMATHDARDLQSRYEVACQEMATLQAKHPGAVAVVAFSDSAQFCPGGVPIFQAGGTDLAKALRFVKVADGTVRFVVISDGHPDSADAAIEVAQTFTSRIDSVFVGSDPRGAEFLTRLSAAAGGQHSTVTVNDLCAQVETLLLAGV